MTGKKLYLRYAFPCAEGRCLRKEITEDDLKELIRLVRSGEEPKEEFLNHCFPLSFGPFTAFSLEKYPKDPWSIESVRDFWRNRHGRLGDEKINPCHTEEAVIVKPVVHKLEGNCSLSSLVFPGNHDSFFGVNLYEENQDIREGDKVVLHQKVIVEKLNQ